MNMKIRHLNIEVTKRCNQRCFYCFNDSGIGSPASELTPEKWLNVLHAQSRGLESVHLTGGEPFSYPGAIDILVGVPQLGLVPKFSQRFLSKSFSPLNIRKSSGR